LAAPPGAVFEIVSDHARYDRFDGIRRSELVNRGDPDPNGLGAVRLVWLGPLRFEEEVTAFEPPRRLDYLIRDVKTLPFRHEGGSIRLEPDGTGTHAIWTSSFEIPIPLIGAAMDGIFKSRAVRRASTFARPSYSVAEMYGALQVCTGLGGDPVRPIRGRRSGDASVSRQRCARVASAWQRPLTGHRDSAEASPWARWYGSNNRAPRAKVASGRYNPSGRVPET
jgi:hypothetical protein